VENAAAGEPEKETQNEEEQVENAPAGEPKKETQNEDQQVENAPTEDPKETQNDNEAAEVKKEEEIIFPESSPQDDSEWTEWDMPSVNDFAKPADALPRAPEDGDSKQDYDADVPIDASVDAPVDAPVSSGFSSYKRSILGSIEVMFILWRWGFALIGEISSGTSEFIRNRPPLAFIAMYQLMFTIAIAVRWSFREDAKPKLVRQQSPVTTAPPIADMGAFREDFNKLQKRFEDTDRQLRDMDKQLGDSINNTYWNTKDTVDRVKILEGLVKQTHTHRENERQLRENVDEEIIKSINEVLHWVSGKEESDSIAPSGVMSRSDVCELDRVEITRRDVDSRADTRRDVDSLFSREPEGAFGGSGVQMVKEENKMIPPGGFVRPPRIFRPPMPVQTEEPIPSPSGPVRPPEPDFTAVFGSQTQEMPLGREMPGQIRPPVDPMIPSMMATPSNPGQIRPPGGMMATPSNTGPIRPPGDMMATPSNTGQIRPPGDMMAPGQIRPPGDMMAPGNDLNSYATPLATPSASNGPVRAPSTDRMVTPSGTPLVTPSSSSESRYRPPGMFRPPSPHPSPQYRPPSPAMHPSHPSPSPSSSHPSPSPSHATGLPRDLRQNTLSTMDTDHVSDLPARKTPNAAAARNTPHVRPSQETSSTGARTAPNVRPSQETSSTGARTAPHVRPSQETSSTASRTVPYVRQLLETDSSSNRPKQQEIPSSTFAPRTPLRQTSETNSTSNRPQQFDISSPSAARTGPPSDISSPAASKIAPHSPETDSNRPEIASNTTAPRTAPMRQSPETDSNRPEIASNTAAARKAPPGASNRPQQQEIKASSNPFGRPPPQEIKASSNPFGPR